jgi:putative ABC transport system permease protein
METLWLDVKYAARTLHKSPGFAAVVVLTLALGIGANAAIFSVVNSVLLRPYPYPDPDRLVLLWQHSKEIPEMMISYPDYLDWLGQNHVFADIAIYNRFLDKNLTGRGEPERLSTAVTTSNLFPLLGVKPVLGRGFLPEEDKRGGSRVALLSHAVWQRRFGGDPHIVGESVRLDNDSYTVVGVLPADFHYLRSVELWVPMGTYLDDSLMERSNHKGMIGLARLKPGATFEQARTEMQVISQRLATQYPASDMDITVGMGPLMAVRTGSVRATLLVLLGAVGFVLLIACANVANLMLARATARQRETGIRAALGASRSRLVRQLMTESLVLSALGGGLGLLLAGWGVDLLRSVGGSNIPRVDELGVDARVIGVALLATIFTSFLFGIVPALQAASVNLQSILSEGGRGGTASAGRHRFRRVLVVSEIALSLVLLVGAGLLVRSFLRLAQMAPGFNPENVMTMRVTLPEAKYKDDQSIVTFTDRLVQKMQSIPGITSAAVVKPLPFSDDGWESGVSIEGQPTEPGKNPSSETAVISPDYFRTMGIPILSGRSFNAQDTAKSPRVVIVNQTFARRFWPGENPLGKRIKPGEYTSKEAWIEVVGVVGDVRLTGLDDSEKPEMYIAYPQSASTFLALVARTSVEPASVAAALRAAVAAVDKDQPVFAVATMRELVASSMAQRRFSMALFGGFAALALVLAIIGVYGVMSYAATQRTHEMGLRMALGATPGDVLRLIVGQGAQLALTGVLVGLAAAGALAPVMASQLFDMPAVDPVTFAGVAALLSCAAIAACYVPARRAARVDPMVALRYE